jgi:hypothetical protein
LKEWWSEQVCRAAFLPLFCEQFLSVTDNQSVVQQLIVFFLNPPNRSTISIEEKKKKSIITLPSQILQRNFDMELSASARQSSKCFQNP